MLKWEDPDHSGTDHGLAIDDVTVAWTVPSAAPSVTSSAATSVGSSTATLNGNVTSDGGSAITERGFVYKTTSGVTIADNKTTVSGTTGSYTLGLSSLTPNQQYFFKAYAINAVGTTLSSPELSFTTAATAVPKILVTLPGEASPNAGGATAQTAGTAFNITLTATTDGTTTDTSINGSKSVSFTGPTGSPTYPSTVSFNNGVATANMTLTKAETTTITTADTTDSIAGNASSSLLVNPGAINSYTVTASSPQIIGIAFPVTVTAKDANNNTVTTDSSTSVTMGSGSGNVTFDVNPKTLVSGTFSVNATDNAVESTTITATDGSKSGTSSSISITPPPTYHWAATSGSASWTTAASWSPSRTTPTTSDILVFDQGGSSTATGVPAETIGKFQVSGNTSITLQAGGANTLTVSGGASAFSVAGGSALNVSGSSALIINLPTGTSGSVSGSIAFAAAAHRLTAADATAITFQSGSSFTADTGFAGNAFGTTSLNSIVFGNGSTYVQKAGSNPFGASAPSSVVVFQSGSLFSVQGAVTPSFSGRTYANFEYNVNSTTATTGSGTISVDDFSVLQGAFTNGVTGTYNQNGNVSVASGATLILNCTATTASGKSITANGTLGGSGAITGPAAVAISASGTLTPGTPASIGTLTFASAPTLSGATSMDINRNGGSPLADKVVLSSGTLTYGGTLTINNIGATLTGGEVFDLFDAASFSGAFAVTNVPSLGANLNWWYGQLMSDGKLVVNRAPAGVDVNYTRAAGASLTILKSDLVAGASDPDASSGDLVLFDTLLDTGTQSATIYTNATSFLYEPANNNADTITFRLKDTRGGTVTKSIFISVSTTTAGGAAQNISPVGSGIAITFGGIPNFKYDVERADDVGFTTGLITVMTTNAPANGVFTVIDNGPFGTSGYYRLKYNPN